MSTHGGILVVVDGWGEAPPGPGNAIAAAATPSLDRLRNENGGVLLDASGSAVGLPEGTVGNSEIGHLVMGAGRPLEYDSLLVQQQVDSGELSAAPALRHVCAELVAHSATLHLVGLCSNGRIHSDVSHVRPLLRAAADAGLARVRLHAITDGRDVADGSAATHLDALAHICTEAGVGRVSTVVGRSLAMDKGGDPARTARAVDLILDGTAERTVPQAQAAAAGPSGDGDIVPTVVHSEEIGVRAGDAVLFWNFRSDRTAPLVDLMASRLAGSGRSAVTLLSLSQYDTVADVLPLVRRVDASGGVADALDRHGLRSVRVAEPEKFEHVTFFFNGRDARDRPREERIRVPGSTDDYVTAPGMNVLETARTVAEQAARDDVALIVTNVSNIDVVGHTGNYDATVRATEAADRALDTICAAARAARRWVLLVGDHGNGEQMFREAGTRTVPYGGHTDNLVPCVLVPADGRQLSGLPGLHALPSVGVTVLDLLRVDPLPAMTAPSLLVPDTAGTVPGVR